MGIEHAGTMLHTNHKGRTQNLCTYPKGIEYTGIDPIQYRNCAPTRIEHPGTKPLYKSERKNTELMHIS